MKRILFIVPLPPPVHGSSMMCEYIRKSKVINGSIKCSFINLSVSRKIDEIGKKTPIKIIRFCISYLKTLRELFIHNYDSCYIAITCHGLGFIKDAPYVLISKLFCKEIFIHQHNKGMTDDVDRLLYKMLMKMVYKNTTVILLSWKLYPDICKIVRKSQIKICPNGIPDITNKIHNKKKQIPNILFLSNLIESKGVYILLDACKILRERNIKFTCTFVGAETQNINSSVFKDEVKKRGLMNIIEYVGKKYGYEKNRYLNYADVFVLPSLNDCYPLVLLEAMQYKLPIISTYDGGIPDIIENGITGYLCKQQNVDSLVDKLILLINNSDLRIKMGEAGRKRYEKFFTLNTWEQRMKEILSI